MKGLALVLVASLLVSAGAAQAPRTFAETQAAARVGNADAQFRLGEAYRTGTGAAADRDQAIAWFKRAADQGNQPARDALGMLLFTRGNRQEAMPLIEAAAARGDARALYILATARFNGDYVARDWPRAYAEMSRAAELGLPQARSSLTQMEPYLLPADRAKADQIRATMAATAPSLPPAARPRAAAPELPRIVAAPAPVVSPARNDESLGLPMVPATGDGGGTFTLAPSPGTMQPPSTPPAPAPAPALAPAPAAPAPAPRRAAAAPPPPSRAAPPPVTVPVAPPRGNWRVQLGAYGSRERAEMQWRALADRYPALARQPHVVTPAGALFRLQAEGVPARGEAASLCRDVVAGGGGCFPVAP